jgi:PIN domain nuclease of toxin-antitoxin system
VSDALANNSGLVSTVNLAEVASRIGEAGATRDELYEIIAGVDVEPISFDLERAVEAALLRGPTKALGLSLGDRACLALAVQRSCPVLTADRAMATADLGLDVQLLR